MFKAAMDCGWMLEADLTHEADTVVAQTTWPCISAYVARIRIYRDRPFWSSRHVFDRNEFAAASRYVFIAVLNDGKASMERQTFCCAEERILSAMPRLGSPDHRG